MIVYKNEELELIEGDIVELSKDKIKSDGFYNSEIGKKFKSKIIDKAQLQVKKYSWLEVYFELSVFKNNKILSEGEFYELEKPHKGSDTEAFHENGDYTFLRYFLKSGAIKV